MSPRLPLLIAACLLTAHTVQAQVVQAQVVQAQVAPAPRDMAPVPPSAASTRPAPPPPPRARRLADEATQVTSGRIQHWLVNPNGDADGIVLADGTQVAFPPHLADDVTGLAKVGDTIQVTGWRAPGVPVMRAQSLSANGRTVTDRPPEGVPRPPREPGALAALSASGKIERLLYNDRGDAHGVVLSDHTIVRFPPHVGASLAGQLTVGSGLYAVGWGTRGKHGAALEATQLGASADSLRDVFGPPPAMRGTPLPAMRGTPPQAVSGTLPQAVSGTPLPAVRGTPPRPLNGDAAGAGVRLPPGAPAADAPPPPAAP